MQDTAVARREQTNSVAQAGFFGDPAALFNTHAGSLTAFLQHFQRHRRHPCGRCSDSMMTLQLQLQEMRRSTCTPAWFGDGGTGGQDSGAHIRTCCLQLYDSKAPQTWMCHLGCRNSALKMDGKGTRCCCRSSPYSACGRSIASRSSRV